MASWPFPFGFRSVTNSMLDPSVSVMLFVNLRFRHLQILNEDEDSGQRNYRRSEMRRLLKIPHNLAYDLMKELMPTMTNH